MTKESQETIRRLEVLAWAYDRSAKVDSGFEREAKRKARSIRAAIKQIEMMEGE